MNARTLVLCALGAHLVIATASPARATEPAARVLPVQPAVRAQAPVRSQAPIPARAGSVATTAPSGARRFTPLAAGAHVFYGRIAKIDGTTLVLQTRRNRLVTVDASTAIAAGTYSAPLFVGKLVSIDGTVLPSGVFAAGHITRIPTMNGVRDDH